MQVRFADATTSSGRKIDSCRGREQQKSTRSVLTLSNGRKLCSIPSPDLRCKGYDAEWPCETNQHYILLPCSLAKSCNASGVDERPTQRNNSRSRPVSRSFKDICSYKSRTAIASNPHRSVYQGQACAPSSRSRCDEERLDPRARRLRVTSYLRVTGGAAYEHTDWESCSATSSCGCKFSDFSSQSPLQTVESLSPSPTDPENHVRTTGVVQASRRPHSLLCVTPPPDGKSDLICELKHLKGACRNEEHAVNLFELSLNENYGATKEVGLEIVSFAKEVAKETIQQQTERWQKRQTRSDAGSGMNGGWGMRGIRNWEPVVESDPVRLDLDDEKVRSDGLRQVLGQVTHSAGKLILTPTEHQQRLPQDTTSALHKRAECKGNANISITNSQAIRDASSVGGGRRMGKSERSSGTKDDQVVDSASRLYPLCVNQKTNLSATQLTDTFTPVRPHAHSPASHLSSASPKSAARRERLLSQVTSLPRPLRAAFVTRTDLRESDPASDDGDAIGWNGKRREDDAGFKGFSMQQQQQQQEDGRTHFFPTTCSDFHTKISVKEEHRSTKKNHSLCPDAGVNMPHAHAVRRTSKGLTIRITGDGSESSGNNHRRILTQERSEKSEQREVHPHAGKSRISFPSCSNEDASTMNPSRQQQHEARNPNSSTNNNEEDGAGGAQGENGDPSAGLQAAGTPAYRRTAAGPVCVPEEMRASHLPTLPTRTLLVGEIAEAAVRPEEDAAWLVRQPVNKKKERTCSRIQITAAASPVFLNSFSESGPPLHFFDDILRESFHHQPDIERKVGSVGEETEWRRKKKFRAALSGTGSQAPNAVFFVINEPSSNFIISRRETGSGVSSCILIHQVNQSNEQECSSSRLTAPSASDISFLPSAVTCNQTERCDPHHLHPDRQRSPQPNRRPDSGIMTRGRRGGRVMQLAAWMESEAGRRGGGEGSGLPAAACCMGLNGRSFCDANHSAHRQQQQLRSALFLNPLTNHYSLANGVADHGFGSKHNTSECDLIFGASNAAASSGSTTNASANDETAADPVLKQSSPHHVYCSAKRKVTFSPPSPHSPHPAHHNRSHSPTTTTTGAPALAATTNTTTTTSSSPVSRHSPDSSDYAACLISCPAFPVRDPTLLITGYADDLVEKILRALLVHQELRNRLQERGASSPVSALSLIRPHPSHPREQQQVLQQQQRAEYQQTDSVSEQQQQQHDSVISLTSSISSQLEQYFTQTLTSPPSATSPHRNTHSACDRQQENQSPCSSTACRSVLMSKTDVSVQPNDTRNTILRETDENSGPSDDSSLDSDDGLFLQDPLLVNEAAGTSDALEYGNPFSYSLHTILEESERSCDEDHSEDAVPCCRRGDFDDADVTDAEACDYFRVAKRSSLIDPKEADESDLETERSSSPISGAESMDSPAEKDAAAGSGSSRLEKYFTFGLVDPAYSNRSADPSLTHSPRIRLEPSVHHQVANNISDTKFTDDSCSTMRLNKKWNHKGESRQENFPAAYHRSKETDECSPDETDESEVSVIDKVHDRQKLPHPHSSKEDVCQTSRETDETNSVSAHSGDTDQTDNPACDNQLYTFMNKVLAQVASMKSGSAGGQAGDCRANLLTLLSQEAATLGPAAPASQAFLKALQLHLINNVAPDSTAAAIPPADEGANNSDYGSECSSEERKNGGRLSASPVTRDHDVDQEAGQVVVTALASDSSPSKSSAAENNCSKQSNSQSLPTSAQTKGTREERLDCIGNSKFKVTSAAESISNGTKDQSVSTDVRKASAAVSESGDSDATVSASISLPSYDSDNNNVQPECDVSMEMDDLFSSIRKFGSSDHRAGDEDMDSLKSWEARIALLSQNSSFKSKITKAAPLCHYSASETKGHPEITVNGRDACVKMNGETHGQSQIEHSPPVAPLDQQSSVKSGSNRLNGRAKKIRPEAPLAPQLAQATSQNIRNSCVEDSDGQRTGLRSAIISSCSSPSDPLKENHKEFRQGRTSRQNGEPEVIAGSALAGDASAENGKSSPVKTSRSKAVAKRQQPHKNILNLKVPPIPALSVQLQHARLDPAIMQRSQVDADKNQEEADCHKDINPCRPVRSNSKSRIHPKSSSPRPPVLFPDHLNLESSTTMHTKQRAARFAATSMSLSSGNIPDAVACDPSSKLPARSDADPNSTRSRSDSSQSRTRMLFTTSGVLKKLAAFKGMFFCVCDEKQVWNPVMMIRTGIWGEDHPPDNTRSRR